jgi:hypothetical protein
MSFSFMFTPLFVVCLVADMAAESVTATSFETAPDINEENGLNQASVKGVGAGTCRPDKSGKSESSLRHLRFGPYSGMPLA